jgi:Xaa-Pro aminopeptidase
MFIKLGSDKFLITDGRYEIEALAFAKNCEVIITNDLVKVSRKILKNSKIKRITFDPYDFTVATFEKLAHNLDIKFLQKPNFSKLKRIIKDDYEVELLKEASVKGRKGFKVFASFIKNYGLDSKEKFLHFKAKECLSKVGNLELSFDPIVAINANAAKPHALPTSKKLKKDDLILVDAGIKYKRYCSDRTCTSSFDDSFDFSREQKFKDKTKQKVYDIVLEAQHKAIKKTRVGMKAKDIDKIARDVIVKAGYGKYFVHSTGHGVGLDIHEYPVISSRSETIIEENMVFTIEPGIYLPNEYGVRIEDTVVMKNGKAVIL